MDENILEQYEQIRRGKIGFYRPQRGLIEISGKEAVPFLNGLITNDVAKLEDGGEMLAAFPNAQGRLLAVVRVQKTAEKFLFETEAATHEKVFQNLFRFTFAGDFFVTDRSGDFRFYQILNFDAEIPVSGAINFKSRFGTEVFIPQAAADEFEKNLLARGASEIGPELYELMRIERGIPLFGADMDETTIVPELGLDDLISYNKGCYIGQEIIARIYFRGHVAKQLRGLVFETEDAKVNRNDEIKTPEGKSAGRVTSAVFSPALGKIIALAFVRYDYLAEGTELRVGDTTVTVKNLPFVR